MKSSRQRWVIRGTIAAACVVAVWFWPLFQIVPLEQAEQESLAAEAESFDPAAFVEKFWNEQLIPAESRAVDAQKLIAAIQEDHAKARKTRGRSVGLSSTYYYFISGTGRVTRVERNTVALVIRQGADDAEVLLESGPIFGNAVRDATGLLDVNDYANSQDFNRISSEINRRIEAQVLPTLRKVAVVGGTVRFVGCVQITDETTDLSPLRVVPFIAEAQ
ncbi:DUF2291 domain-containing protein [Stieleria sp. ICT_E10.1]|uniref:DUF2291 domain-containing protein n=1 Tax=Stieleria sedimenti TaxID=2976331 RepID=UPI00217F4294|nr:DUF2291 domain-containing protein [Stieleria sedimenti]MCS7468630.1 DUF2291 domain-containing protein [Stieleria sedimenti]